MKLLIESGYTIEQFPHGYVRYVDHLGTDQRIVESARVSYGNAASKGEEADRKLIFYLFRNRHTSPFEQCNITFNIKLPIFCMRQFVRHRTFRLNEWSGRYSELKDEFFYPSQWRIQDKKNKQSSIAKEDDIEEWNRRCDIISQAAYRNAYSAYEQLLEHGVAKELARIVLPVGVYTAIYVNCDLHNLIHFLNLRLHPHAQLEIQEIAYAMQTIMGILFPWTYEAYRKWKPEMVDCRPDATADA